MIRRLLVVAVLLPWSAGAQQAHRAALAADVRSVPQEAEWSIPQSRFEIYAGIRGNDGADFLLGGKYSHRLPGARKWAAAGFTEVVFTDPTLLLFGGLLQWMPINHFLLETGPGLAVYDGGNDFFWRAGAEYELLLDRLSLRPKVYVDFVNSTTVVTYGLAIGSRR